MVGQSGNDNAQIAIAVEVRQGHLRAFRRSEFLIGDGEVSLAVIQPDAIRSVFIGDEDVHVAVVVKVSHGKVAC